MVRAAERATIGLSLFSPGYPLSSRALGMALQGERLCPQVGAPSQGLGWGGVERIFDAHSPLQGKLYPNKKH